MAKKKVAPPRTDFDLGDLLAAGYQAPQQTQADDANLVGPETQRVMDGKPARDRGLFDYTGAMGKAIWQGAKGLGRNLSATADTLTGDNKGIEDTRAAQMADNNDPAALQKLQADIQAKKAANPDAGWWDVIKGTLGSMKDNKEGAAQFVAQQLPNVAVSTGTGLAAMHGGAAIGTAIMPGVGTLIGGGLGYLAGSFLGNALLEVGSSAIDKADGGLTDQERHDALKEGSIKSGVITAVEGSTMGVGKLLAKTVFSGAAKAGAAAEAKVLAQAGVDITKPHEIVKALANEPLRNQAEQAGKAAAKAASTVTGKVAKATGDMALESLGEGGGEYLGTQAATGKGDKYEAVMEALSAAPGSAMEMREVMHTANGNNLDPIGIVNAQKSGGIVSRAGLAANGHDSTPATPVAPATAAAVATPATQAAASPAAPSAQPKQDMPPAPVILARQEIAAMRSAPDLDEAESRRLQFLEENLGDPQTLAELYGMEYNPPPEAITTPATPQAQPAPAKAPAQPAGVSTSGAETVATSHVDQDTGEILPEQPSAGEPPQAPMFDEQGQVVPEHDPLAGRTDEDLKEQRLNALSGKVKRSINEELKRRSDSAPPEPEAGELDVSDTAPWRRNIGKAKRLADQLGINHKGMKLPALTEAIERASGTRKADVAGDITGGKIDNDWSSFSEQSGTLGIPRSDMPQIKAEHRGAMVNFLKGKGIEATPETIPSRAIKPTQAEFSPEKVKSAMDFTGGDRAILVSADGHVVDGHHQWLAKREKGEPIKALRLDTNIRDVLDALKGMPSAQPEQTAATPGTELAVSDESGESKQFTSYAKWINDGKIVSPGMREQIQSDERLAEGEAGRLLAMADKRGDENAQPETLESLRAQALAIEDTLDDSKPDPEAEQKLADLRAKIKALKAPEKAKWLKAITDNNRLAPAGAVQLAVTPKGGITFMGDPETTKAGRAMLGAFNAAKDAGATDAEIAEAIKAGRESDSSGPKPAGEVVGEASEVVDAPALPVTSNTEEESNGTEAAETAQAEAQGQEEPAPADAVSTAPDVDTSPDARWRKNWAAARDTAESLGLPTKDGKRSLKLTELVPAIEAKLKEGAEDHAVALLPVDDGVFAEALGGLFTEADQVRGEDERYAATFRPEIKSVSLPRTSSSNPKPDGVEFISKAEADDILKSWKDEVDRQGKENLSANANRTVISLFDASGVMSQPWIDAGYNVVTYDIQTGEDINDFDAEMLLDRHGNDNVWAIIAQPPCTDYASSGARWWADKDKAGVTELSNELVRQTMRTLELFRPAVWWLENPVGRIKELNNLPDPVLSFDPWHFGDPWTKRTNYWGNFNPNLPTAMVEPVEGSKVHKLSSSAKYERSLTPEGVAYAMFMANNAEGMGVAGRLSKEFHGVARELFDAALSAGRTEADIRDSIEDAYYDNDLDYVRDELVKGIDVPPPLMAKTISDIVEKQMSKAKSRAQRLRTLAKSDKLNLEQKLEKQDGVKKADADLRKMRQTVFEAEDAAMAAFNGKDLSLFAGHKALFPDVYAELAKHVSEPAPQQAADEPVVLDATSMTPLAAIEALIDGKKLSRHGETVWVGRKTTGTVDSYVVHSKEDDGSTVFTKGPVGASRDIGWGKSEAAEKAIASWDFDTIPVLEAQVAEQDAMLDSVLERLAQQGQVTDGRLEQRRIDLEAMLAKTREQIRAKKALEASSTEAEQRDSLESIFAGLQADGEAKSQAEQKAAASQFASRIEQVEANFHDALIALMEAGTLKVNGQSAITEDNRACL